jgi:hypothetical protein
MSGWTVAEPVGTGGGTSREASPEFNVFIISRAE